MNGNQWCARHPVLGLFVVVFAKVFIAIGSLFTKRREDNGRAEADYTTDL